MIDDGGDDDDDDDGDDGGDDDDDEVGDCDHSVGSDYSGGDDEKTKKQNNRKLPALAGESTWKESKKQGGPQKHKWQGDGTSGRQMKIIYPKDSTKAEAEDN
jgi:hypothetical protein